MAFSLRQMAETILFGSPVNMNGYTYSYIYGKVNENGNIPQIVNGYECSISSSSEQATETFSIEFNVSLNNSILSKTAVIKNIIPPSINLTIMSGIITDTSSVPSGSTQYTIKHNGYNFNINNNTDLINYLNNYKTSYGKFPTEINFIITTTLNRPEPGSNDSVKTTKGSISLDNSYLIIDYEAYLDSIILRPSEDVELTTIWLNPDDSTNAYSLINETVSDESATHIATYSSNTGIAGFKLFGELPNKTIRIASITLHASAYCHADNAGQVGTTRAGLSAAIKLDNIETNKTQIKEHQNGSGTGYEFTTASLNSLDLKKEINKKILKENSNQCILDTILYLYLSAYGVQEGNDMKGGGYHAAMEVSQAYIELLYEEAGLNIYTKSSNVWHQAHSAYQKRNGSWVEITEDECKSILSNATVVMKSE